jgi:hypothetical protein
MNPMMHHSNALRLLAILTLIALPSFAPHATAEPVPPHPARVPDDRFHQMAQETAKALQADEKFSGFDTEILVARPFVILMTRDPDGDGRPSRNASAASGLWRRASGGTG